MGGRFGKEATWVYLWLILVDVWQKTTKFCKAIILQLKKNKVAKNVWHNNELSSRKEKKYELNCKTYKPREKKNEKSME